MPFSLRVLGFLYDCRDHDWRFVQKCQIYFLDGRSYVENQVNIYGTKLQKHTTARCSLVVTDPTTLRPIYGLCMGDLTGTPVLRSLWSYVTAAAINKIIFLGFKYEGAKTSRVLFFPAISDVVRPSCPFFLSCRTSRS